MYLHYFNSLPHTEVDGCNPLLLYHYCYFNSLPHTEVDMEKSFTQCRYRQFQLTTSHRGRPDNIAFPVFLEYFNSLPHTEVDSNLSQNSERTSMNHITNRTINLYFFHFKYLITITKRKKAVFFWCESPRKIMCTLH